MLAAGDAALYVAFDIVDQFDDLLLAGASLFELAANDKITKQLGRGLRREAGEVLDDLVQAPIQLGLRAFAVAVPQCVMHRIRRYVVTNHVRYCLLEQVRSLAGLFGEELEQGRGFGWLAHARHCDQVGMRKG